MRRVNTAFKLFLSPQSMVWKFVEPSSVLLLGYFAAIAGISFLGGRLPSLVTMTHNRTQLLMSLISGFIIGIAIYHLLLHGLERASGPEELEPFLVAMLAGVVAVIILLRAFPLHRHEPGDVKTTNLFSVVLGLGVHSVIDGIALGSSVRINELHRGEVFWGSFGVFLAIFTHKPLDSYSIVSMMKSSNYSPRARNLANLAFAALCPLVMVFTFWSLDFLNLWGNHFVGYLLAFGAGAFLCISLSDILPEIQFHRHDRFKLTLAFLIGVLLSYALHLVKENPFFT